MNLGGDIGTDIGADLGLMPEASCLCIGQLPAANHPTARSRAGAGARSAVPRASRNAVSSPARS